MHDANKIADAKAAVDRGIKHLFSQDNPLADDSIFLADIEEARYLIADTEGNLETAKAAAELCVAINQKYRPLETYMGHSYNNLGRHYGKVGDYIRAIDHLHRAMEIYRANGAFSDVGTCLENLADIALQRGDTTLALQHLTDAQLAYHGVPEKPGLSFALDRNQLKDPILEKARITYLLHADHPERVPFSSVSKQVERVDSIFNLLQYEVRSEFSKRNTIKELKTFYEGLLDFSLKGWNTHKDSAYLHLGINCIAKSKAQILRERQRRSFARNRLVAESLNDQRYSFLSNRNSLINTIRQEKNEQKKEQLLEELDELELQIRYLEDSLYYKTSVPLQEQSITPVLTELSNEIPSNHMVLDYFVGQEAIYLSTLYRGELSLEKVDVSTETIIHRVNDLQRGLRAPGKWEWENNREWRDSTQQSFVEAAHFLYQHLVFPFTDRHPAVASLTIIQDGPLSYLPFAALLTNTPSEEHLHQYQEYPFLNKNFTINYEFSAGTWSDRLGDEYSGGSAALLVCPVQEEAIDLPIIGRADPVPLAPLAYAETEIEQIAAQTKSEELRGEKTTELGLGYDLDKYGILHFTGHGLVFPLSIYQSGILLGDGSSLSKMKLLQLPELSSMRLNLEMLVLSACETGFGEISEGEGMISLSRGGAIAGARSVVASHWLVNQNSKVEFFREYYQNLRAGESRSRALQMVKHSFIEGGGDQSHPYHWASFTLTGETAPLDPAFFR
ncbi:CHAT domain-containing protein [Lewinella sp. W8]|uniref:CHAT domain-containing protein n=1 Tax=Lewinella sp. W8 TaxID=2528208 RepID=UPI00156493B3|nr:CHAT domain-containing tetratricopeptide repeat protein [Lewinella sp. W8]